MNLFLFHVNLFVIGSHSDFKGVYNLCVFSCVVTDPLTFILLSVGWLMGNVKSGYLCHEVSANRFCGEEVTGLNPVTS